MIKSVRIFKTEPIVQITLWCLHIPLPVQNADVGTHENMAVKNVNDP
jgi:hypothetical protein